MHEFVCPTKIYFGTGAVESLRLFQAQRVLLVTDPYFSENGTAMKLQEFLPSAQFRVFDRVTPDPSLSIVTEGVAICRKYQPELLIALGGGSALDCAKGILYASDCTMQLIAIPTTSGSGSEMTSYTVLSHNGQKTPIMDPTLRPAAAILDDNYLKELPKGLIANAGMDILAHCMEALVAESRNEFTDALALHAAQCVLEKLIASYHGELNVRMELHEAAAMAGLAFEQAGLGVCHALAHAMGGVFSLPHGTLCGMLLPSVMQMNAEASAKQYAKLAKRCGLPVTTERLALRSLIGAVEKLRRMLQMPENLAQAGIERNRWIENKEHILQLALQDPCCKGNPVIPTMENLEKIYRLVAP